LRFQAVHEVKTPLADEHFIYLSNANLLRQNDTIFSLSISVQQQQEAF